MWGPIERTSHQARANIYFSLLYYIVESIKLNDRGVAFSNNEP